MLGSFISLLALSTLIAWLWWCLLGFYFLLYKKKCHIGAPLEITNTLFFVKFIRPLIRPESCATMIFNKWWFSNPAFLFLYFCTVVADLPGFWNYLLRCLFLLTGPWDLQWQRLFFNLNKSYFYHGVFVIIVVIMLPLKNSEWYSMPLQSVLHSVSRVLLLEIYLHSCQSCTENF